jgi:hypothetical protein
VCRNQLPTSLFELRRDKATQHIEASIKRTNDHPDNGSGLCCQYRFLEAELRTWANSVIAHRFARSLIILKVGFLLRSTNYAATGQPDNQHRSGNVSRRSIMSQGGSTALGDEDSSYKMKDSVCLRRIGSRERSVFNIP